MAALPVEGKLELAGKRIASNFASFYGHTSGCKCLRNMRPYKSGIVIPCPHSEVFSSDASPKKFAIHEVAQKLFQNCKFHKRSTVPAAQEQLEADLEQEAGDAGTLRLNAANRKEYDDIKARAAVQTGKMQQELAALHSALQVGACACNPGGAMFLAQSFFWLITAVKYSQKCLMINKALFKVRRECDFDQEMGKKQEKGHVCFCAPVLAVCPSERLAGGSFVYKPLKSSL